MERDGRIEATATELYQLLEEREATSLPERAEELEAGTPLDERSCGLKIEGLAQERWTKGRHQARPPALAERYRNEKMLLVP